MSGLEFVLGVLDQLGRQHVPLAQLRRASTNQSGPAFHRPQLATLSALCITDVSLWWSRHMLSGFIRVGHLCAAAPLHVQR